MEKLKKIIKKWRCSQCGTWHPIEDLDTDKNGARVCKKYNTRVKSKPKLTEVKNLG